MQEVPWHTEERRKKFREQRRIQHQQEHTQYRPTKWVWEAKNDKRINNKGISYTSDK